MHRYHQENDSRILKNKKPGDEPGFLLLVEHHFSNTCFGVKLQHT